MEPMSVTHAGSALSRRLFGRFLGLPLGLADGLGRRDLWAGLCDLRSIRTP
jgi:hypothetical protein